MVALRRFPGPVGALVALLCSAGCADLPSPPRGTAAIAEVAVASCDTLPVADVPSAAVILLIDHSASLRPAVSHEEAFADAAGLVQAMPPGSSLEVRWLTAESYSDGNRALHGRIPFLAPQPRPPRNRFDPAERRRFREEATRYKASLACVEHARGGLVAALQELEPPGDPSTRTDVTGAVLRAGQTFAALPSGVDRVVGVWSDLDDDVGRPMYGVDLTGVSVLVRTQRSGPVARSIEVESRFESQVEAAGGTVHFSPAQVGAWSAALAQSSAFSFSRPTSLGG